MNYIYKLTEARKTDESGMSHTVYGIEVFEKGNNVPIRRIDDIFTDLTAAKRFVSACNVLALDTTHLDDVVYDTLNA